MKIYIFVQLGLCMFALIKRTIDLTKNKYPMVETRTAGQDVFGLIVAIGFIIWMLYLVSA